MKLPGSDRRKAGKEAVSLLVSAKETERLREDFAGMQEADIVALLSSLDEGTVTTLHTALLPTDMSCKAMVSKDLAQKLASRSSGVCSKHRCRITMIAGCKLQPVCSARASAACRLVFRISPPRCWRAL